MKNGMDSCAQSAARINQSNPDLCGVIAIRTLGFLKRAILQDLTLAPTLFVAFILLAVADQTNADYQVPALTTYTCLSGGGNWLSQQEAADEWGRYVVSSQLAPQVSTFTHWWAWDTPINGYSPPGNGQCEADNGLPYIPGVTTSPPYDGLSARILKGASCSYHTNSGTVTGNGLVSYAVGDGTYGYTCNIPSASNPKSLGQCPTGNPIYPSTANKAQVDHDYISEGLNYSRWYNSTVLEVYRATGSKWRHSYYRTLAVIGGTEWKALLFRESGRLIEFRSQASTWLPDADIPDRLTELKDASGIRTGWRYTVAADDSTETYSATGKLLTIADRSGRTQTLSYTVPLASGGDDDPDTLDTVTDDVGRKLRFGYDTSKRIATVTDPAGGVITYGYDSVSNLVSVKYPDGRSKTYHYNEPANTSGANLPHALTGITDENGIRYATYQYQADGKAIATEHANNADLHSLTYNPDGSTTVTDPLGTVRTHTFQTILGVVKSTGQSQPGGSGCGPASSATTYDANGNVASRADFNGNKTCYAYELSRNLETARVEGLAAGAACPANLSAYVPVAGTAERKILTAWHPTFRLPVKITEAGRETSSVYDTRGNLTSTSIKDTALNKTRSWSTTPTYHATVPGVLVKSIDNGPRIDVNDLTTTDYYAPDATCPGTAPLGCRGQIRQISNALGHITTYNEYDAHGRVKKLTDPNALVTTFAYSPRGWLTSRSVGSELTQFDYDAVGQLIKLTRPDASFVRFEYDPAHRLTAIVQQDNARLTYTLDPMGNRTAENITDAAGTVFYTHRRSFDALGRLWQDIGALNQTITYGYDARGNLKTIDGARTDVADLTRHSYDTLDRLTQTLNADGGIEKRTPNALDQTTTITDPANQTTTLSVNALDDVTQTVSPDTGTTIRTYDEAGNLKTEKDARNVTVSYSYDALNRLTSKSSSQPGSPVYQYFYDECGRGRLCWTYRGGTLNNYFNYDAWGRVTYRNDFSGVGAYSDYTYRPGGQIERITYPTGRSVTYGYDTQGRISQISTQPQSGTPVTILANQFTYYPLGPVNTFTYGNSFTLWQTLNQDYRLGYRFDGPETKAHAWHPDGTLKRRTTYGGPTATYLNYGYDATGRLVSAIDSAVGSLGFSYDQNGNRLSETRNASVLPYTYSPAGSNWLYQKGSDTRGKTANGNTASMSAASFTYDGFNRLATSTTAAETTTYTYNALGERMKKRNQNGLQTIFHYGPNGELLYEKDQAGNTKAYVWLDGRPLARIDNDATIYYYHVDHLGTPQAMTNAAGTTVWKADYEPFGKATVKVGTIENNLRFPGQYFDRETGLHYNYFRSSYDPGTGRYGEADPIGLAGGLNLYSYVDGNPINRIDPTGLFWGNSAKCVKALNGFEAALKSCKDEWKACQSDDKKQIEFIDNYGGGFISTAIFNCAIQKNPDAYNNMIRECGSAAVSPRGPWPIRKP